jgi:acyl phosphate:glycerol-3-phosphate acyltransferase
MLPALTFASAIIGYLIGSFPSAFVVSRLWGRINLLSEGSSHISATAVYRKLGWAPFVLVILIDLTKGMSAVYIANLLTGSPFAVDVAAVAAVAGHCWSVYIKFRGGLGATTIYGIMLFLAPVEFLISAVIALIAMFVIKKSTITTLLWLSCISIALFVEHNSVALSLLPLILFVVQIIKQWHSRGQNTAYKNDLMHDFKRVKKM